jgi:ABC-type cobalamin transport system permease subunit
MWDFKVSKSEPTNKHTLQLLMYWIMGQHSGMDIYKNIDKVGIFNPRLNKVYLLEMNTVSQEIIKQVEDEVICY